MGFQEDIRLMRDSYYELERRFIEITRIIPMGNSDDTYSPILYDILQSACGQVESLFRLICDYLEFKHGDYPDFPEYFTILNRSGILERQVVEYFVGDFACKPFVIELDKKTPFWWRGYNDTKHKLPDGYKQGNLKNTIFSLAAVYALQCIAAYCVHSKAKILENEEWMEEQATAARTLQPTKIASWINEDIRPRSNIFYPVSYYRPMGGL